MQQEKITVNKDLQHERERCTFNPIELTHLLDGSPEKTQQRRKRGTSTIILNLSILF